jgi:hypothetical protein
MLYYCNYQVKVASVLDFDQLNINRQENIMHFINRQIVLHCLLTAVFFVAPINNSYAFHQDIEVKGIGTKIQAGFCLQSGTGCDIAGVEHLGLPPNTLPTDFETGKDIYVSAFTHFVFSGQHSTADPGFQATPGALRSNELISYKALGVLEFWSPSSEAWGAAPDNVQIRLAGGLFSQSVADQSCGLLWCPPKVTLKTVLLFLAVKVLPAHPR